MFSEIRATSSPRVGCAVLEPAQGTGGGEGEAGGGLLVIRLDLLETMRPGAPRKGSRCNTWDQSLIRMPLW